MFAFLIDTKYSNALLDAGAQIRAESWPRCPRGWGGGAVRSQGGTFEDGGGFQETIQNVN